jgi:hypothetical protein
MRGEQRGRMVMEALPQQGSKKRTGRSERRVATGSGSRVTADDRGFL